MTDPTTIAHIQQIATTLYGKTPQVHPLQSHWWRAFLLEFPEGMPEKVIKVAREGCDEEIIREQRVIHSLYSHGIPVPTIEASQADIVDAPFAFTLMPRTTTHTLGEIYSHMPDRVGESWERVGAFLAHLQMIPPAQVEGSLAADAIAEDASRNWESTYRQFAAV